MPKLIYSVITSLDGYIEDEHGRFDWATPDEEVHAYVNEVERPIGTYLYGRGMFETMRFWETAGTGADAPEVTRDFAAIWRAADKVVYSRTLEGATSSRTRIEREFDPVAVRRLIEAATGDVSIGGAELAAQALAAGLVDECHLFVAPVLVGAGKPSLPARFRSQLELLDLKAFQSGVVHLQYRFIR